MHISKHLSFASLRSFLAQQALNIEDLRQASKVGFGMHDCLMSAFAMMYLQDPSVNCFQQRLQDTLHRNNLTTVFDVKSIPKDSQLRDCLDGIDPEPLAAVFPEFLHRLQRSKHLVSYRILGDRYLIAIDGSQYFSSYSIHCKHCLRSKKSKGVRYHHAVLQPALINPDMRQVFPLAPEFIRNTDGSTKQDCETNATKRLVEKLRNTHPKLNIVITGDGLYSNQPTIDKLKEHRMSFILVAKPSDHKLLFEQVQDIIALGEAETLERVDIKGRRHVYLWENNVLLNGTKDADYVNFYQYTIFDKGKQKYHNSWVTDIAIDKDNIVELVKGGRCRWKIENEMFNTLKNQGYHAEHSFGHGKQNLSEIFVILNLIAFFMHQIFELTDRYYQGVRNQFSSRKEFWNQLRCTLRVMIFDNWQHLLNFLYNTPEIRAP